MCASDAGSFFKCISGCTLPQSNSPPPMTLELFSADINRFALTTFSAFFSAEVREANCIIIAMSRYVYALDIMGEFRELVGIGIELRDFCTAGSVVARSFSFFHPDPTEVGTVLLF